VFRNWYDEFPILVALLFVDLSQLGQDRVQVGRLRSRSRGDRSEGTTEGDEALMERVQLGTELGEREGKFLD
jgi:hypothetical protein